MRNTGKQQTVILKKLFRPIDIAPLVFFRVVVGGLITIELAGEIITDYGADYFHTDFHFSYLFFEWLKPWPSFWMHLHFAFNVLMALFVTLGLYYRASALLLCLGTTSAFLMEKSVYINHTYLYCLTAFLMIFIPAHKAWSLDVRRKPRLEQSSVPAWTLWILLFQISVVYIFAGLAKLNPDWFRGTPLNIWLPARSHYFIIGPLLAQPWLPYVMSWGGAAFDLLVVPLMLWRFTRRWTFFIALTFHFTNVCIFGIGTFPWYSMAMTALFFPPHSFRKLPLLRKKLPAYVPLNFNKLLQPAAKKAIAVFLALYMLVQIAVPLRQYTYAGNSSWTEAGHNFSWHMMLRSKRGGSIYYRVVDPASGEEWQVDPRNYITPHQYRSMTGKPDMILELAHHIRDKYARDGYEGVEVYAHCSVEFNGRPNLLLTDTTVNLSQESRRLGPYSWVLPFEED
nr:HTTM domain-containing protein [Cesiribacter sp. SM1]